MTTVHILEKSPVNTFLCFLNDDDAINRAFSHALEHNEFPFNGTIALRLLEHCQIERTGINTVKTKYGEKHLSNLDRATKLALVLSEKIGHDHAYNFVALSDLDTEPMRWLSENYDLTLYCMCDDIMNCPSWMTFGEHIRFINNGKVIPNIFDYWMHRCTFTKSKEAQSFEKHFGSKLMLKHDHVAQYSDLNAEVDIDEYTTSYTFGDLLDELDIAEKGAVTNKNSHYAYTAILSGGVSCFGHVTKYTRIYLISRSYDYIYGRIRRIGESTNGDILRRLEDIYEWGDSDSLIAIIADGECSSKDFADDYIPYIQYGVEIDFVTKTVYILDPTSAAVKFHNALQDSFITDEQHPHIYWQY